MFGPNVSVYAADFSGDGIADLILNPINPNNTIPGVDTSGNLVIMLGRGDGSFDPASPFSSTISLAGYQVLIGNFSGSGLGDILMDHQFPGGTSDGHQLLFTSNGDSTFAQVGGLPNTPPPYTGLNAAHVLLADFLGVGHLNVMWDNIITLQDPPDTRSNGTDLIFFAGAIEPDLMTGVVAGLGAQTTITYAPLSAGLPLYTKDRMP